MSLGLGGGKDRRMAMRAAVKSFNEDPEVGSGSVPVDLVTSLPILVVNELSFWHLASVHASSFTCSCANDVVMMWCSCR